MASGDFILSISETPVAEVEKSLAPSTTHGADLRFRGVVRDLEDGRAIDGIDYSCYREMAETELAAIAEAMRAAHPDHRADIHHRVGFVAAGEASLLIRVQTKHSAAAFEIAQEYLKWIKTTLPVWKNPVFSPAGEQSDCEKQFG